jgi:hypothetical protein
LNLTQAKLQPPRNWHQFFGEPLPEDVLKTCPISMSDREYFMSLAVQTPSCQDDFSMTQCASAHKESGACLLCA